MWKRDGRRHAVLPNLRRACDAGRYESGAAGFCTADCAAAAASRAGRGYQAPGGGQTWNQNPYVNPEQMDINSNKGYAILSYFSLLVLIPIFAAKDSKFARFHANQGLVLMIAEVVYWIAVAIVTAIFMAINWWLGSIFSTIFALGNILFLSLPFSALSPRAGPVQSAAHHRQNQHPQISILQCITPLPHMAGAYLCAGLQMHFAARILKLAYAVFIGAHRNLLKRQRELLRADQAHEILRKRRIHYKKRAEQICAHKIVPLQPFEGTPLVQTPAADHFDKGIGRNVAH